MRRCHRAERRKTLILHQKKKKERRGTEKRSRRKSRPKLSRSKKNLTERTEISQPKRPEGEPTYSRATITTLSGKEDAGREKNDRPQSAPRIEFPLLTSSHLFPPTPNFPPVSLPRENFRNFSPLLCERRDPSGGRKLHQSPPLPALCIFLLPPHPSLSASANGSEEERRDRRRKL